MANENLKSRDGFSRSTSKQVLLAFIANFSSIAPSMSMGFSAIILPVLLSSDKANKIDDDQASWIASITAIAIPFGSLLAGPLIDKFGRKPTLILINIVAFFGWAIILAAFYLKEYQYYILLAGRIVTGLSAGMASVPATVYVVEISSTKLRGVLTAWPAVFYSIGILIVYTFGYFFKQNWGMIAGIILAFPCVGIIVTLAFLSESPNWLVSKGKVEQAKKSMQKIYGVKEAVTEVEEEVQNLIAYNQNSPLSKTGETGHPNRLKFLTERTIRTPFLILFTYVLFQQFSGIAVLLYYAVQIAKEAGVTIDPYLASVGIAASRLISSILFSVFSKKYGRRPLSIFSGVGMTLCMIPLAGFLFLCQNGTIDKQVSDRLSWLPVVLLITYVLTSTVGFMTIPFAMVGELFPGKIRGTATAVMTCVTFSLNFVVVKIYPSMIRDMGKVGLFFFYGVVALVGTIYVAVILPETRGKTLEQIEQYFAKNKADVERPSDLQMSQKSL